MKLYNTLTRQKDDFAPLGGEVTLYACGPTVYNYAHIGNMRTYIFEDLLVRTLRLNYKVKHVMNVTDVGHLTSDADCGEDKMELGAAREGKSAWDIAKFYEQEFFKDFDALNCARPTVISRATEHIADMIALVKTLEERGFTYKISDGIYFDTSKFPGYHQLAGKSHMDGLKSGARVEFNTEKKNASDFALWKFSPSGQKRQMEWDSLWGVGFPGWHIECSAMSMKYLGPTLDIHCGGVDHVAVHHTNEIAQSEAATGKPYARFWLHGEFLVLHSGKMSKSAGTFLTVGELVKQGYAPLDYRYLCLGAHYRTQLEFTFESLDFARASLKNLKEKIAALKQTASPAAVAPAEWAKKFTDAAQDDLNISKALSYVWEVFKADISAADKLAFIAFADGILGLDLMKEVKEDLSVPEEVSALVTARAEARTAKDFKLSDELRDKIFALGFVVKDTPQGQKLEKK